MQIHDLLDGLTAVHEADTGLRQVAQRVLGRRMKLRKQRYRLAQPGPRGDKPPVQARNSNSSAPQSNPKRRAARWNSEQLPEPRESATTKASGKYAKVRTGHLSNWIPLSVPTHSHPQAPFIPGAKARRTFRLSNAGALFSPDSDPTQLQVPTLAQFGVPAHR